MSLSPSELWQKFIRYWHSSNHSALVLAVLCVVLILAAANLGGRVLSVRKDVLAESAKIDRLEIIDRDYRVAAAAVTSIEAHSEIFDQLVPDRDGVLRKIQILESLAARTGNTQSIVIKESPPEQKTRAKKAFVNSDARLSGDFSGVDFVLTLNGNFKALISYLDMLESQPVIVDLDKIAIRADQAALPAGGVNQFVNLAAITSSIEGTIFYRK